MKGGVEFPILNWGASDGKPYDHFWAAGFGAILPDRDPRTLTGQSSTKKPRISDKIGPGPTKF